MVIQVAWVVANFVHIRGDDFGQTIVLLQIDRQISGHLSPNLHQCFGLFLIVDCDTDHISPSVDEVIDLPHGGINVGRLCRCHALDRDRCITADKSVTHSNFASRIANDGEFRVSGHGYRSLSSGKVS